jgi:hypothetical protein
VTSPSYAHQLTGDHLTEAVAERVEAARRAPWLGCPNCRPREACSRHIAEQLMEAVRQEDLVLMPLAEADAIIHASVDRLVAERTRDQT